MTPELLTKIQTLQASEEILYQQNKAYVKGKNPGIYEDKQKAKPDNRLPIPFAKMAVDDMCGYAGRSEDMKIEFDSIDVDNTEDDTTEETYREIVRNWMDYNSDGIETAELYRESLGQGKSYEIWWTSENDEAGLPIKPEYKIVDGNKVYIKYSNSIKPVKEYAVYFNEYVDFETDEKKQTALVMYQYYNESFTKVKDKWVADADGQVPTPFSVVPCIEFKCNKDKEPIFEAEKNIIDQIDKICSKSLNEVDRFNALILLLPALADAGLRAKFEELQVIDDIDRYTKDPSYLAKDLAGVTEFYKWLEDLLEKMFRKSIKIPDMTSETFGGSDESGVARAFKMLGMEFVAAQIETYFIQALYERKQLFDDVINAGTLGIDTSVITINVHTKRNLPVDETAKVALAVQLQTIGVSKETILKMLPSTIIPDVEKELAQGQDENAKKVTLLTDDDSVDNMDNETA